MLDAPGLQRSAARYRRLQTHSSELFDLFGDLIARPRLLICGLGVRFPPGSPDIPLIANDLASSRRDHPRRLDAPGVRKKFAGSICAHAYERAIPF
jgi:hypothetical protein